MRRVYCDLYEIAETLISNIGCGLVATISTDGDEVWISDNTDDVHSFFTFAYGCREICYGYDVCRGFSCQNCPVTIDCDTWSENVQWIYESLVKAYLKYIKSNNIKK